MFFLQGLWLHSQCFNTVSSSGNQGGYFDSNSGIPFQMGVLRPAVRFAFDNSIGSLSDPITANNGIAVFHIINEKPEGYKPLDVVKDNIKRTLQRELKKDYAINLINSIENNNNWETIANSDSLLQFNSGENSNIGGSFSVIGKSNQLTGTLLAMNEGQFSNTIETFNAIVKVKMTQKDIFNDSLYQTEYNTIRNQLLNTERNRGYTSWLTEAKKKIEIEDYRSEVY